MIRCGYTMAVYIDEMAVLIISSFLTSIKENLIVVLFFCSLFCALIKRVGG